MREDNLLYRARLDSGLHLADVATRTCLSPRVVERIDSGRFDELPAGIYARSYVRSFAAAVGLDPEEAVRALADVLPRAEDPIPVLRDSPVNAAPAWLVLLTGWTCSASTWLTPAAGTSRRRQRRIAARAIDALLLLAGYGVLVRLTAVVSGAPPEGLVGHPGVTAVWIVLACLYALLLAGIGGRTLGESALGIRLDTRPAPLHLRAILSRAFLF